QLLSEVLPACKVILAEASRQNACLLLDCLRKLIGQSEGADDRQRIDTRLPTWPEHLDDDALTAIVRPRESEHLDNDLVTGASPFRSRIADCDAMREDSPIDTHQS